MPSSVSNTVGFWVLAVPVLITGWRAPERWDSSWHPGLILTSINTSRGSPWSDYTRGWIKNKMQRNKRGGKGVGGGCEDGRGGHIGDKARIEGGQERGERSSWMMKGGGWRWWWWWWWGLMTAALVRVHKPAAVGPNDGGHWHAIR